MLCLSARLCINDLLRNFHRINFLKNKLVCYFKLELDCCYVEPLNSFESIISGNISLFTRWILYAYDSAAWLVSLKLVFFSPIDCVSVFSLTWNNSCKCAFTHSEAVQYLSRTLDLFVTFIFLSRTPTHRMWLVFLYWSTDRDVMFTFCMHASVKWNVMFRLYFGGQWWPVFAISIDCNTMCASNSRVIFDSYLRFAYIFIWFCIQWARYGGCTA